MPAGAGTPRHPDPSRGDRAHDQKYGGDPAEVPEGMKTLISRQVLACPDISGHPEIPPGVLKIFPDRIFSAPSFISGLPVFSPPFTQPLEFADISATLQPIPALDGMAPMEGVQVPSPLPCRGSGRSPWASAGAWASGLSALAALTLAATAVWSPCALAPSASKYVWWGPDPACVRVRSTLKYSCTGGLDHN